MHAYIRGSDWRQLIKPTSPLVAFIFPWLFVLIGQQMALCGIIEEKFSTFYLIIIGNMFTMFLIAFFTQSYFPQRLSFAHDMTERVAITQRFKNTTFLAIMIYLASQAIQILYFKGFPLLWLVVGSDKTYADYGFSSVNGFINGLYLLATTALYLIYLKEGKKTQLLMILTLLFFPIMFVSRQTLISVFLQLACCGLIYRPQAIRKFAIGAFLILLAFVVVGNMRTGLNQLVEILKPAEFVPPYLYSLLWIYAYIVTPFNNLNAAMDVIRPLGEPYYELTALLPTILRPTEIIDIEATGYSHVHANMNVATFYFLPILDMGGLYAFAFMVAFQVMLFLAYRRAVTATSPVAIIEYAVLYMIMVLSIFSNLFLFLPVIIQLVMIHIAKWRIKRSAGMLAISPDRFQKKLLKIQR